MNWLMIRCLQLILVIVNCELSVAYAPTMTPATSEITLYEGEPLEIMCYSFKKLNFYYPNSPGDANTSSVHIEQVHSDVYEIKFRREKTVYGDTGWYGCAETDVHVTPNIYNEPDVTWIYVYVQSNTNYFVNNESVKPVQSESGEQLVLGCRPTSPKYHVIFLDGASEKINITERGSYDPRKGAIIDSVDIFDGGYIACQIEYNNDIQKIVYILHIWPKKVKIPKPIIDIESLGHVVQGQELRINCSVDVDYDLFYHRVIWTTPRNSSRINTVSHEKKSENNSLISFSELIIKDIDYDDEGEYVCTFNASGKSNSSKIYIKVHDPNLKFINLIPFSDEEHYQYSLGAAILWIVNITGHPPPDITWLDPSNNTIISDHHKYIINKSHTMTSLKIHDLEMSDMGIYTLQAESQNDGSPLSQRLTFNLTILSEPVIMEFENIKPYYKPNEEVKFLCEIAAYPPPEVAWSFRKYSAKHNSMPEYLENFTSKVMHSRTTSTLAMRVETSGNLTCIARNELGNSSFEQPIFISDVPNGFGIFGPSNSIAVGDDVELLCGASIYNYTDSLEWIMDEKTKQILIRDKKMTITNTRTPFTYLSVLQLHNVDKTDEEILYTCSITTNNITQQDEKRLVIHDAVEPYFIRTNMNGTENIYDSEIARKTIITLECYVNGMPPPIISWWKDDQIVNATDDLYIFSNKNRELEIKHPRVSDSGKYSCKATNRLKTIETYQLITVHGEKVSKVLIISVVILVIMCVILVIYFSIKMHREKVMRKQLMEAGLTHFEEGALECLNPELTVDDQAELLPYDKKWEFPRERLKFGKQLGCGAFGVVMKAEAQGISESETITTVAVKMVRRSTESTYIRALASELKIMVHLGKHLNVVNLLGACTRNIAKRELLVIVEYCRFGNLHNYLLRHRSEFINQIDPATQKIDPSIGSDLLRRSVSVGSNNRIKYAALSFSRSISKNSNSGPELLSYTSASDSQGGNFIPDGMILSNNSVQPGWRSNYRGDYKDQNLKPICTQDLLSWAFQVARGMEYLSQRKVLHGDLAARNILLSEDNIVKICDFGLAKTMYKDENYKKKGDAPLPIKWMAIESIRDRIFSTQSDIWSFGIVLWEFFTLAETPYPGMEAEKQYQKLIEGYRMEKPEFSTVDIYDIMLQCWKAKPTLRPTFTDLVQSVGSLLDESVKMHYLDLNTPYMDMNTLIFESGKNDYLTMMSAPDHVTLSSPTAHEYVNSPNIPMSPATDSSYICMTPVNPKDDTRIFSPRNLLEKSHFNFPSPEPKYSINSDSESEAVEFSPMLKNQEDNYLKPINVHERRAEFARQRNAMKNSIKNNKSMERDSGYCNAPQNLRLLEVNNDSAIDDNVNTNDKSVNEDVYDKKNLNSYTPGIIRTEDNYVNMPKHKNDLRKDTPDSFTNPSYVFMANKENDEAKV